MNDQNLDATPAEDSFLDFKCPYCDDTVSFPATHVGQANECPSCSETLVVPERGSPVGRRLPIPITTSRLTLRRLALSDLEDLAGFMGDEDLFRYFSRPMDEREVEQWLEADSGFQFTTPGHNFYLAVVRNDTQKVIGWAMLQVEPRFHEQATLGLVIARDHQRNGFGTEAIRAVLDFCLRGIHLHRVVAFCDGRDEAGQSLLEKSGMRYEAQFLEERRDGDAWVDTLWFALLQREYPPGEKTAVPGGPTEAPG